MARKTKMNNLTSPELLEQVNPDNMQLKKEFLDYLRSVQRSPGTISGYSNDLDIFFVWVLQNARNKSFVKVTKRDIIAFQGWLINTNENSSSRVRRIKAAISSLSNYCENILADDEPEFENYRPIVRKIENPVLQPVREKTVWADEELQELLDKLIERESYDKACYLALAMYSGRRKAELCRFKVSDFSDERLVCGGALYKSAPIKTKGKSGGRYIQCYTLAKQFRPYLDMWLKYRADHDINSDWLFPTKCDPGKHIPVSTANSWANTYSRLSGRDAYMHSLRHYFTSSLSKAGIPDRVIQSIQSWASGDMVRVYIDTDTDEELSMYFTSNGIVSPEQKSLSDL